MSSIAAETLPKSSSKVSMDEKEKNSKRDAIEPQISDSSDSEFAADDVFMWEYGHKDLEADIARDLNKLSLEERNEVLFDIHGVGEIVKEDAEFVQQKLLELEVCLSEKMNKRQAKAYKTARELFPEYVERNDFRIMFLRANKFHINDSADQILRHFQMKLDLFGMEKLGKDITYDDLDPEAQAALQKSHMQILPKKDPSGRLVLVVSERHAVYDDLNAAVSGSIIGAHADDDSEF